MGKIRAFLAIPLPERLIKTLSDLQLELSASAPDVRWVRVFTKTAA